MKCWTRWTPEEDARLARLRSEGIPAAEIGRRLNRSAATINAHACRLKLVHAFRLVKKGKQLTPRHRWSAEEDAELICLRQQGLSAKETAKQLNHPVTSVQGRINLLVQQGHITLLSRQNRTARLEKVCQQRNAANLAYEIARLDALPKTRTLGYVVGVLYGDGFVVKWKSIGLKTTNLSFANAFAEALEHSTLGNAPRRHSRYETKNCCGRKYTNVLFHEVLLHDKALAQAIWQQYGPTTEHDWKIDVERFLTYGREFCLGVLQGFYDSEGSIWTYVATNRKYKYQIWHISASSSNSIGLQSVTELLRAVGLHPYFYSTRRENRILLSSASDIRQFATSIGFNVDYKIVRLKEAVAQSLVSRRVHS